MSERNELRSSEWFSGDDEVALTHRAALRSIGLELDNLANRPIIGIANTASDLNSCNLPLREIANSVKRGVLRAGGIPLEFPTMSLGEELMMPSAMLYRNLLAMETEEMIRSHPLDGIVLLGNCDKTVPAQLMGAASADIPALVVTGGARRAGEFKGAQLGSGTDLWRYWEAKRRGELSDGDWSELESCLGCSRGACNTMGTASTMAILTESLGMMLAGGSTIPADDARRLTHAERSGRRIVEMALSGPRPSAILTRASFTNALIVLMAIGGSTNAILHLCAIAGRRAIELPLQMLNALASKVPVLVDVMPVGRLLIDSFHEAGGVPRLLAELAPLLDGDVMTVSGATLGELLANRDASRAQGVIRPLDQPLRAEGAIRAVFGNMAPSGAVIKTATASPNLLVHSGPAIVFRDYVDMLARIDDPDLPVTPESVLVLPNCGPVGVPGMPEWGMIPIPRKLAKQGVRDMVRVSDGRMSGTSYGTVVLHVSPEAAVGGTIGLVRDGDIIHLDVAAARLDVEVTPEELVRRRRDEGPPSIVHLRGWPRLYQDQVTQAPMGCDFAFLRAPTEEHLRFIQPVVGRS